MELGKPRFQTTQIQESSYNYSVFHHTICIDNPRPGLLSSSSLVVLCASTLITSMMSPSADSILAPFCRSCESTGRCGQWLFINLFNLGVHKNRVSMPQKPAVHGLPVGSDLFWKSSCLNNAEVRLWKLITSQGPSILLSTTTLVLVHCAGHPVLLSAGRQDYGSISAKKNIEQLVLFSIAQQKNIMHQSGTNVVLQSFAATQATDFEDDSSADCSCWKR